MRVQSYCCYCLFSCLALAVPQGIAAAAVGTDSPEWKNLGNVSWSERYNLAAVNVGNTTMILGGRDADGHGDGDDTWASDDGGSTWHQVAQIPWSQRSNFPAVALPNGTILVMGGNSHGGVTMMVNDVWASDDGAVTWRKVCAEAPWDKRGDFQAVVLPNGTVVIMGGNSYSPPSYLNDIWASDDAGATWRSVCASAPWHARSGFAATVLPNSTILIMGGRMEQMKMNNDLNDIWASDDGGASWRLVSLLAPWVERSHFHAILLPNATVLIMGGQRLNSNFTLLEDLNDVWAFDDSAGWREVSDAAPWSARSGFAAIALPDGNVLVMGGQSGLPRRHQDDVWAANFSSPSTTLMMSQPAGHDEEFLPFVV